MKRTVSYYNCNYENDTAIEYVETGLYSALNCSYTSEDPDSGTETIRFVSEPVRDQKRMAYELLKRIGKYLNALDEGRMPELDRDIRVEYVDYTRSTLIAVENALVLMTKDYKPTRQFVTIEEAGKIIADEFRSGTHRLFHFCESCKSEAHDNDPDTFEGEGWYGVKRIDGFFDNSPCELIVAVGYWGGGNCSFAYVWEDDVNTTLAEMEIADAICESTGGDKNDVIFLELDDKEEN